MSPAAFEFYTAPHIVFGAGSLARVAELLPPPGRRVLLLVGRRSAEQSGLLRRLEGLLPVRAVARCGREPVVDDVDRAVAEGRGAECDAVVAVGGGAVIDCGKAASGMLTNPGSLVDYLEGVGRGLQLEQVPAPMLAAPTTAGTGSEVTKNAVVSGPGFKKSIRSPMLIPRVALIDPELTHTMPAEVTASCGMDALTQLIEAYLSTSATPFTDGLALQGIAAAGESLVHAWERPDDAAAREGMMLASVLGGICLANAGLGAVHGFASPLGALFPIPHGVACAALLPQVVAANLEAVQGEEAEGRFVARLARVGDALTGQRHGDEQRAAEQALARLRQLQGRLGIPRLGQLGVREEHLQQIVDGSRGSSMRHNPVELSDRQLERILRQAL